MRRVPLGVWFSVSSLLQVLLVVAGLVPATLVLLERLATENARARVEIASLGAVEGVEREADDTLTSARLLAERPTLLRLLQTGARDELARFLESFRATGELDLCAAVVDGVVAACAPPDAFPSAVLPASEPGLRYWVPSDADATRADDASARRTVASDSAPMVVASASIAALPNAQAVAIRRLDDALVDHLEQQVGLPVRILAEPTAPSAEAHATDDAWRSQRKLASDLPGSTLAVEVALSKREVAAASRPLRSSIAVVSVVATLLAVAAGVVAGRHLSRPLELLGDAARRIGAGDFATPVPAARGAEAGALASTMETMRSRLRAVTAELRHREHEARALLDDIVEGVFAVDGERRIGYLNSQAAAQLGVTVDEALGRFCGDVLRPAEKDGVRPCEVSCPIVHARSRGSSRAVEHLQLAGGRRTVVVTSAPPAGARQVQVMRDETEIEAARRSRDAVLATVSHELRTPLTAQLASIELLRDALERRSSEASSNLVDSLERSTLRLTRLIDNLLESVRIETGKATFRRVPVELAAILEDVQAMTRPLLDQRRQSLEVDLPASLAHVQGDPGQLTQVFVNLLANANKYAPEDSTIRIGGANEGGSVSVWVEDEGPGIPAAESNSIFDRFHRADSTTDGMGLGLWIVKSIVERHGGRVSLAAPRGRGARFTITLPGNERRVKILVVDDDPELLPLVAFALRQAGFLALEAKSGEEALRTAKAERPDLVILDVELPGINGFEVCRTIRAAGDATPILVLTVRSDEEDMVHGLDLGADDYLTKPFSPRTLLARVRALLRRAGTERVERIEAGDVELDEDLQSVRIAGRPPVRLTPLEFRLLQILAANPGRPVRFEQILRHVWGGRTEGDRQHLKQLVHRVRQKLEDDPAKPERLCTEPNVGYRLASATEPLPDEGQPTT